MKLIGISTSVNIHILNDMMKRFWTIILVVLNGVACNFDDRGIHIIESDGLNIDDNLGLNTLIFLNKDTGFIAGSVNSVKPNPIVGSDTFAFVDRRALLYRTINGGKTWVPHGFGSGYFTMIKAYKNILFAFKTSEDRAHFIIYESDDFGNNWREMLHFPPGIRDLFMNDTMTIAITYDSSKTESSIHKSLDSLKSWTPIIPGFPIYNAVLQNNKLVYLSTNIAESNRKNLLVSLGLNDGISKVIELPKAFDCYFITNYFGSIRLIGLEDKHITIYFLRNDNELVKKCSYQDSNTFFPQSYYNTKDRQWLIVGRRKQGHIENTILISNDSGMEWNVVNFKRDDYIKPFYFMGNENVKAWFYSGSGKFQILDE